MTAPVALVTGASRGLGRAIAARLGAEGYHVACGYLREADAARELAGSLPSGEPIAIDVTAPDSVRDAVGGLLERRGRIDLLVCSHGVVRDGLFAMAPERDWLEVIDANLTGAMRCARAVVRPMMGAGGGACVFVASVAGLRASPGQAGYAASKGGLLALTRTLAAELGPKHIRVNAVVPGLIDAGMVKRMDRRRRDERLAHVPLGRLGEAREVADAVEFLASAGYVTGQALVVDGGALAVSVAVAFAGQGAETPRMGVAMAEAFPAARALLDAAGPAVIEALHRGRPLAAEALQPALVAVQLGAFEALRAAGVAPKAVLGHSLGELAAWAASGAIDGVSAVRLAQVRGAAMAQAAAAHPGGMVALATGSLDAVGEALAAGRAVGVLSIAAHNAPREWVLSGDDAAVRAAVRACGGRRLDVAGPWHAPTMASARAPFARALAEVEVRPARVTFVANATGEVAAPDAIPALLERQLVRPVRWARAMRTLARLGVTDLVIAGPGKPLRHLARGTGLGVHACEDPADVARIAEALR